MRRGALVSVIFVGVAALNLACVPPNGAPGPTNAPATNASTAGDKPSIAVTPVKDGPENWKVADADSVSVKVTAPGAKSVQLLYRPTSAEEGEYVKLKNALAAKDAAAGDYATDLKLSSDFAGEVWAEATYADGQKKQTDEIALRRSTATAGEDASASSTAPSSTSTTPSTGAGAKSSPEVSALSDSVTGGKIQTAEIAKGDPNLKITINIPSFQLSLWQSGKLVKTYPIGVGKKEYPLPAGDRTARSMILNPDWVPPDSEWVRKDEKNVTPGETIPSDDPRNPIGDVKIPLGDAILIHEGRESNLGGLASHGCARMVEKDLLDLVTKIATAQDLSVTPEEIATIAKGTDRKDLALKKPVPVEISYDTAVVQDGKLYLYPDVYDKGTNTAEVVEKELADAKVTAPKLDDAAVEAMLKKVTKSSAYVVSVADLSAGKGAEAGKTQPIVARGNAPAAKEGDKKGRRS